MKKDTFKDFEQFDIILREFESRVNDAFDKKIEHYAVLTPEYNDWCQIISNVLWLFKLSGIKAVDPQLIRELDQISSRLNNSEWAMKRSRIVSDIDRIMSVYSELKDGLSARLGMLTEQEKERLNEALHCHVEGCYYASVAMAVSAIEARLFSILKCYRSPRMSVVPFS